ncbi:hypothetical protein MBLNU459_g8291t1 [Dothideomycetes sp. NU459]
MRFPCLLLYLRYHGPLESNTDTTTITTTTITTITNTHRRRALNQICSAAVATSTSTSTSTIFALVSVDHAIIYHQILLKPVLFLKPADPIRVVQKMPIEREMTPLATKKTARVLITTPAAATRIPARMRAHSQPQPLSSSSPSRPLGLLSSPPCRRSRPAAARSIMEMAAPGLAKEEESEDENKDEDKEEGELRVWARVREVEDEVETLKEEKVALHDEVVALKGELERLRAVCAAAAGMLAAAAAA